MTHPPFILALTLSLTAVAAPVMAKPQCWELQPGPSQDPAMVAWWGEGKRLLETPANWDTARAYKELKSWGYCTDQPIPKSTPQPAQDAPQPEETPRVRSSYAIMAERLEKAEAERQEGATQGKNSWAMVLFLGGVVWAIATSFKEEDDDPLKKLKRERGIADFHSGITAPSPWLADQVRPLPSPAQVAQEDTQDGYTPTATHQPEPLHTQRCEPRVSPPTHDGVDSGVEPVWSMSADQAKALFDADRPYFIFDDDVFCCSVIRLGLLAGLKKSEIMDAFYWLKPEGTDTYKRSPITRGSGNKPYERFTELFSEVQHS